MFPGLVKERLQALRLTTFTDVLDAVKSIEQELLAAKKKTFGMNSSNSQPKKDFPKRKSSYQQGSSASYLAPAARRRALDEALCFKCFKPGHMARECPDEIKGTHAFTQDTTPQPRNPNYVNRNTFQGGNNQANRQPFNRQPQNQQNGQPQNNNNNNQGNRANMNPQLQRQNQGGPNHQNRNRARLNQMYADEDTSNEDIPAHIHAAIEHQGVNNQFSVLQTPAEYKGKAFHLLIDSGSTHSFISPKCIRTLNLPEVKAKTLSVELATGKMTRSTTSVGELNFKLNDQPAVANFRVLPLGIYDGILGMDWLSKNDATL